MCGDWVLVLQWLATPPPILGDSEAVSGGAENSNRARKNSGEKSLVLDFFSPGLFLVRLDFWLPPTNYPWVSEDGDPANSNFPCVSCFKKCNVLRFMSIYGINRWNTSFICLVSASVATSASVVVSVSRRGHSRRTTNQHEPWSRF